MKHRGLKMLALVAIVLATGAGSCDQKGLGDAPIGDVYEAPRDIIVMPDTFMNFAVACDGPTRLYAHTREAAPVVIHNHPACEGEPFINTGPTIPESELDGEG